MSSLGAVSISPFGSSPHRDVLEAPVPPDGISRLVLLNELKNRARPAVEAGRYPEAAALYDKALQVAAPGGDPGELSVLEANLSLCHQKVSNWPGAVDAAVRSTAHDPSYVKGWWRLGQARAGSGSYGEAVDAMQTACRLEPDNKAVRKELERFQKMQSASAPPGSSSSSSSPPAAAAPSQAAPAPKPRPPSGAASTRAKAEEGVCEGAGGDDFAKSDVVRGYKVVNGKKTSYFHNELSQDAARLIGDIAPKRIDSGGPGADEAASPAEAAGSSAWNKAGTWEERDVTKWALESIRGRVAACGHAWGGFWASVSKCDATGHASVAAVRGKKRYIYELELEVEWEVRRAAGPEGGGDGEAPLASGTLRFPEVDGTCGGVYEATASVASVSPPLDRAEVDRHVCKKGLRDEIHGAINAWIELMKETY